VGTLRKLKLKPPDFRVSVLVLVDVWWVLQDFISDYELNRRVSVLVLVDVWWVQENNEH